MPGTSLTDAMRQWATPASWLLNYLEAPENYAARSQRLVEQGTRPLGANLGQQAQTWQTPRASDGEKGGPGQSLKGKPSLVAQAVATWPTPRASEGKGTGPEGSKSHTHRLERGYLDATALSFRPRPTTSTGGNGGLPPAGPLRLNPDFVEALMGWPAGWSTPGIFGSIASVSSGTASSPSKRRRRSASSRSTSSEVAGEPATP